MKWTCRLAVVALMSSAAAAAAGAQSTSPARYIDSQAGLSVEEAVRQALVREPSLRAVRSDIDIAHGQREQAALRPNPTLMFEQRQQPGGSDNATMAQVQWPLDLFRRGPRIELSDWQATEAEHTVADRVRAVRAEVRMRYGAAAAAVRRLDIATRARTILARQTELVTARVGEGAAPPIERDQIDVEAKRAEFEELLAAADADAAMIALKRAIGLPPDAPLVLSESLDVLAAAPAAGEPVNANAAVDRRSDVLVAGASMRSAEAEIAQARANGRFDLSLTGTYTRMGSSFPQFGLNAAGAREQIGDTFHYVSGGVSVTVPIANRNQGQIAAAVARRAAAASRLDAARLEAGAEIAAAAIRVRQATRARQIGATAVSLAEKNLGVIEQSYQLGRSTLNDVLAEQRRYLEIERAQIDTLKAAYDAAVAERAARGEE